MSDMIERVARAIESVPLPMVKYDTKTGMWCVMLAGSGAAVATMATEEMAKIAAEEWRINQRARAAIEAMREPTPEIIVAGERAWMNRNLRNPASEPIKDCYTAMIDAALGKKT